jgi:hypothetical protein
MILGVEVILTIVAWNRGWRGYALIPFLVLVGLAFIVGVIMGSNPANQISDISNVGLIFDVLLIIVLVGMIIKGRNAVKSDYHPLESTIMSYGEQKPRVDNDKPNYPPYMLP